MQRSPSVSLKKAVNLTLKQLAAESDEDMNSLIESPLLIGRLYDIVNGDFPSSHVTLSLGNSYSAANYLVKYKCAKLLSVFAPRFWS